MTTQDKLADALRAIRDHARDGKPSAAWIASTADVALAEHDAQPAPDECFCDRMKLGAPGVSCGDCPTRGYGAQPAPAPVHEGLWRCSQCGEPADAMSSRWRWSGKEWQHHHGAQVGHVNSRYFGSDAAPVQPNNYRDAYEGAREDLLDWKGRAQRAEATLRSLGYTGIDASHPPAPAADGAGELP